jgi:hypothetical protein
MTSRQQKIGAATALAAVVCAIVTIVLHCELGRVSSAPESTPQFSAPSHRMAAMSVPFAELQVSVNGAPVQTGLVTVPAGATIQLQPASTIGVTQWLWEIYDYPTGFTLPSGWTYEGDAGASPMMYNAGYLPPSFTIPSQGATTWGTFMLRLRINGNPLQYVSSGVINQGFQPQLTDESTILKFDSVNGQEGIGFNESTQGDPLRSWPGTIQRNLRDIDNDLTTINTELAALDASIAALWTTSSITSDASVPRARWMIEEVSSLDGGGITLILPVASLQNGDRLDVNDVGATSAATGVGGTATVSVVGTGLQIQNPHTMTIGSSYVLGAASGDQGGVSLSWMDMPLSDGGAFLKVIQ